MSARDVRVSRAENVVQHPPGRSPMFDRQRRIAIELPILHEPHFRVEAPSHNGSLDAILLHVRAACKHEHAGRELVSVVLAARLDRAS